MSNIRSLVAIMLLLAAVLLGTEAEASILYRVRFGYFPEKIRTVFDFDGAFTYEADEQKDKIIIHFKKAQAAAEIQNYVELNDLIVRYLQIEKEEDNLVVTIPLTEPVDYTIFYLNDPPRLVVDFGREFLNIVSGGTIAEGTEYLKVKKGLPAGQVNANVLRVDLDKINVRPALARKGKPNIVASFLDLITPWAPKDPSAHFYLSPVSDIIKSEQAFAGINGTYFAYNGRPLGALMINQELISSSIHDRTAFFLDEKNTAYIDNIFVSSYFILPNGSRYKITGVNQSRGVNDIIMYTPIWGRKTGTSTGGFEIMVKRGLVAAVNPANSEIPDDGYVLSVDGTAVELLAETIKIGDQIDTHVKIIPYDTSPGKIIHLVSGGPRLLKRGWVYVSKYEEQFKTDIAKGRAARTAVGITKDGQLLLVTVDGPSRRKGDPESSIGITLEELSNLMLSLGATEAMNLDGGSSSTMIIDNRVVNQAGNGGERKVSNAIVLKTKN